MICPACNRNIPDGSNYCPDCAADLNKHRRQMMAGRQQPPMRPQQPDPRTQPQNSATPQYNTGRFEPVSPQYSESGGEGGLLEGITPRGKLFFGVGGLVLVAVLALLVNTLFGGGREAGPTPPPANTPAATFPNFNPNPTSLFNTPGRENGEVGDTSHLYVAPTPAPSIMPILTTVLKRNSTGDEVRRLQERLQQLGYLSADEAIDGIYGTATVNAVKEFQRQSGLNPDGDYGPATHDRLFRIPVGDTQPGQQDEEPVNQPG